MMQHYPTHSTCTARRRAAGLLTALLAGALAGAGARAQEMEPRAYSSSPVGMNFVVLVLGNTRGAILFDPSVPIDNAEADLDLGAAGYARTFSLAGRQASAALGFSYAYGDLNGDVAGEPHHITRSGLGDMRVRFAVNLMGPRAMSMEEFAAAPHKTILGVSMTVQPPTGQYEEIRLINLGTNRWGFKPEVGVSVPVGRWFLDLYAGAWFFTANDEFYPGGSTRRQDPLTSVQAHVSYTFKSRAWLAFDATWYGGGVATIDGGPPSARQNNTRLGGTCSFPITRRQSIKFTAGTGASARTGSDFDTYLLSWQIAWYDPPRPASP